MADFLEKHERSAVMALIRSTGNRSTELRLVAAFRELGLRGWRRGYPLRGRPDFVFPRLRVAVFVDGCFWHGCREHCRLPSTRTAYWLQKIDRNRRRDRAVNRELRLKGWKVLRVWEHELRSKDKTRRRLRRWLGTKRAVTAR